ncbi:hypothetical protein [Halobellus captivus]|uniref:hypothetical protein n=1 Tax=Halobellus captivus TaxID=2592614 RepID=UPI0011A76F01|nr:hypothetical protein [Halobellus captivus]
MPESTLRRYRRFSLYNSPYPAHDAGCAIDLYPATNEGRSPVAGEVLETRTVRAPPKGYADDAEHLILIDVDCERSRIDIADGDAEIEIRDDSGLVARILHVRPMVEPGETVAVGDSLGPMIRSGFFAPWVGNHVHVGFRRAEQNLHRAGGSLRISPGVDVEPVRWDGVGTVIETGDTYALLDAPAHPSPGDRFAGIAGTVEDSEADSPGEQSAESTAQEGRRVVLDGGLAHYVNGGALGRSLAPTDDRHQPVSFLGRQIGDASGRTVTWRDVDVLANGDRITGLSLFSRVGPEFGVKLVCPEREFGVGERVEVSVRESEDPIRLG